MYIAARRLLVTAILVTLALAGPAAAQDLGFAEELRDSAASVSDLDLGPPPDQSSQPQEQRRWDSILTPQLPTPETEVDLPVPGTEDTIVPPPRHPQRELQPPAPPDGQTQDRQSAELDEPSLLVDPTPVENTGTWFWRGHWYTQQDFFMMRKSQPRWRTVAVDSNSPFDPIKRRPTNRLSTISSTHRFEPGARFTLGNILGRDERNRDNALEFTYFGLFDWIASASIGATGTSANVDTSLGPGLTSVPGFEDATRQAITYRSDLDNFELNLRIRSRLGRDRVVLKPNGVWVRQGNAGQIWSFMGGLRLLSIDELFVYDSVGDDTSQLRVATHNDMFGLQCGVEFIEQFHEWNWSIGGKLGGLVNFSDRHSRVDTTSTVASFPSPQSLSDENMVFLAEMRLSAAYQIHPHVTLRCAYDVLFVEGFAIASENIALPHFPVFKIDSNALYHGLSSGFELVW